MLPGYTPSDLSQRDIHTANTDIEDKKEECSRSQKKECGSGSYVSVYSNVL